jgi:hypothetical protein
MKFYGYSKEDDNTLQNLNEITFQGDATSIRKIAEFLKYTAGQMEKNEDKFGHEHIRDFFPDWDENNPDLIVAK